MSAAAAAHSRQTEALSPVSPSAGSDLRALSQIERYFDNGRGTAPAASGHRGLIGALRGFVASHVRTYVYMNYRYLDPVLSKSRIARVTLQFLPSVEERCFPQSFATGVSGLTAAAQVPRVHARARPSAHQEAHGYRCFFLHSCVGVACVVQWCFDLRLVSCLNEPVRRAVFVAFDFTNAALRPQRKIIVVALRLGGERAAMVISSTQVLVLIARAVGLVPFMLCVWALTYWRGASRWLELIAFLPLWLCGKCMHAASNGQAPPELLSLACM